MPTYYEHPFSPEQIAVLDRFFTNASRPVFALQNLPEVVKAALFARYSRSFKSLRELFLDEFYGNPETATIAIAQQLTSEPSAIRLQRAEELYNRVFFEYGDDSVAQLGAAHLACEQASNLLTKVLERGRLAAYLEQSTRYIFYDRPLGGNYRYHVPEEISTGPLAHQFTTTMDKLFESYNHFTAQLLPYFESRFPRAQESERAWQASLRAKVCDVLRGLLPAAAFSNVGIFATGQAYEALLVRMFSHPLVEVRIYARLILDELRQVIEPFLRRVDLDDRGRAWSAYLSHTRSQLASVSEQLAQHVTQSRPSVSLIEWDPEAEIKIAAALLYESTLLPDEQLLAIARDLSTAELQDIFARGIGNRENRRHKPGRAFERCYYRFDILANYGAFRDLQRHRIMTIAWQQLTTDFGYDVPESLKELGLHHRWEELMRVTERLHLALRDVHGPLVAQYAVPLAYRIRFNIHLNARQLFHLLELRTQPAGHSDYREVCQEMFRLVRDRAGHKLLADAMCFVDMNRYDLSRLAAEAKADKRQAEGGK